MNTLSAVLLIALILSLALNLSQCVRLYEVLSALRMISECRAVTNRLRTIYQIEINVLRKNIEILSSMKEDGE